MAKVVNTPRLTPIPDEQKQETTILGKLKGNNQSSAQQEILSMTPGFDNLKAFVGTVLASNNYEEVLVTVVDKILKQEQMALTPQTKEEARIKKVLLGRAFSEVIAYGDQQGLLYLLTDKLGYRKRY